MIIVPRAPAARAGHARSNSQFALLGQRRFGPYFWTQFLGAANDNLLKFALTVMVTYQVQLSSLPPASAGLVIGALYILPFMLLSATGGQLADKYDRRSLMVMVKRMEIFIAAGAGWGFLEGSVPVLLACTFLMGLHSTLFGPAKFAYLPQHLGERELTGGNALEIGLVPLGALGMSVFPRELRRCRAADGGQPPADQFRDVPPLLPHPRPRLAVRLGKAIPVAPRGENATVYAEAFERAAQVLRSGELLAIFPEGRVTPDGRLQAFKGGVMKILQRPAQDGLEPVVVPMALDNMWGSFFSRIEVRRGHPAAMVRPFRRGLFNRVRLTVGHPVAAAQVQPMLLAHRVAQLLITPGPDGRGPR